MAKDHIRFGAALGAVPVCAVVSVGWSAGLVTDARVVCLAALTYTAFLVRPDIDHQRSVATHALGPVSKLECELWREVAAAYYTATRLAGDPVKPRKHRGLTHTPVGAVALAVEHVVLSSASQPLCAVLSPLLGPSLAGTSTGPLWPAQGWAAIPATLLGLAAGITGHLLAIALAACAAWPVLGTLACGYCALVIVGTFRWRWRWVAGLAGIALGAACLPALTAWPVLGMAAVAGCLGHDLGDGCTTEGCPTHHPRREYVEGKHGLVPARWVDHGTPEWLRFRTGGRGEDLWVGVSSVGALVLIAATAWWSLA